VSNRSDISSRANRPPVEAFRGRDDGRVELETPRLRLRPFTASDGEAIHAVYADPEVMRYVGHGAHRTTAETARALRGYADALRTRGYGFVAVVERSSGVLIGDGGLHPLAGRGPDVELGYTLARAAWGHGYATEMGAALVAHAFAALGVPRVMAQVEPDNLASRHVLEKLGMTERGVRLTYGRPHLLYGVEREGSVLGRAAGEAPAGGPATAPDAS
jgi:[ribosomal protein S5]-alanine N-acetyltransferase